MKLVITYILFILNLLWLIPIIYPLLLLKIPPFRSIRGFADRVLVGIGEIWIGNNYQISWLMYGIKFDVEGLNHPEISHDKSYLIVSNHQSWADVYVIQSVLNRKVPFIRFFIKSSLKWVPILGQAWMALDFPFVRRSKKADLIKNPALANQDLQNVRNVCQKFKEIPFCILNFVEGHRRTPERMKKLIKKNPYKYLLRANSGGISVVATELKEKLHGVLDLTLIYPDDQSSFLDLMKGDVQAIRVVVDFIPIAEVPIEALPQYAAMSKKMKRWIDERWQKKDELLASSY
ncbi:acyltransferase [Leptospira ognonensis]|uniref:Acyltransferase n=1 Tax=Leptospira ognonensis TaxID=2484945 RepID=A0A4V3JRD4_9LEPT|nr:acetyltransferase [Leptospira ognonensis]TGL59295.1 acyltransferase [Leptospira ognonensis]